LDEEGYPKEDSNGYDWSPDPENLQDDNAFSLILQFESINLRWHDIFFRSNGKAQTVDTSTKDARV
jgi:hypothetical protein